MGTSIFGRFVLTFTTATLLAHEDSQRVAHAARHLSCVPGRNKRLPRPSNVSLFPHLPYLADLFSRLQRLRYSRMQIRRVHARSAPSFLCSKKKYKAPAPIKGLVICSPSIFGRFVFTSTTATLFAHEDSQSARSAPSFLCSKKKRLAEHGLLHGTSVSYGEPATSVAVPQ